MKSIAVEEYEAEDINRQVGKILRGLGVAQGSVGLQSSSFSGRTQMLRKRTAEPCCCSTIGPWLIGVL